MPQGLGVRLEPAELAGNGVRLDGRKPATVTCDRLSRGSSTLLKRGVGVVLGLGLVLAPLLLKRAVTAVYGGVLAIDRRESRMCVCSEGLKKIYHVENYVINNVVLHMVSFSIYVYIKRMFTRKKDV